MGMGFFFPAERTHFPGALKIGAAISGPRIAGKKFYGHEDFSDNCKVALPKTGIELQHLACVA